jgi:hypothetical protein
MLQWAKRAMTNKDALPRVFAAMSRPLTPTAPTPPPGWRPSPNYRRKKPYLPAFTPAAIVLDALKIVSFWSAAASECSFGLP